MTIEDEVRSVFDSFIQGNDSMLSEDKKRCIFTLLSDVDFATAVFYILPDYITINPNVVKKECLR